MGVRKFSHSNKAAENPRERERERERETHTHTHISKDPNLQLTCAGAAIIKGSVTISSKGGPSLETLLEWANCAWPRGVLAAAAS
jgi:hypothetical protein